MSTVATAGVYRLAVFGQDPISSKLIAALFGRFHDALFRIASDYLKIAASYEMKLFKLNEHLEYCRACRTY